MRYSIDEGTISLWIPDDWNVVDSPEGATWLAYAPTEHPFEPQIFVLKSHSAGETDPLSRVVGAVAFMEAHLHEFINRGAGTVGAPGAGVAWLEHSAKIDGTDIACLNYYVLAGNDSYLIHCKTPAAHFDDWRAVFEKVGRSIRQGN